MRTFRIVGLASLTLAAALGASLAACQASDSDQLAAAEQELRALTPNEIQGDIAYGQTVDVGYTATPRYRALRFQGTKGDKVKAWVRAPEGDARFGELLSKRLKRR
jgi:hypothetical protein